MPEVANDAISFFNDQISQTPSSGALLTAAQRRNQRFSKTNLVMPDKEFVNQVRKQENFLMDKMDFEYENMQDWEFLQNRIVFNRSSNQKMKAFIENTQKAKVMAERKMRFDLDSKILSLRNERLKQSLGKDFIQRLRYYIKGYYQNVDYNDSISLNESGSMLEP